MDREDASVSYSYDAADELKSVTGLGGFAKDSLLNRSWAYDLAGNRTFDSRRGPATFVSNFMTGDSRLAQLGDADGFGRLSETLDKKTDGTEKFTYRADGKLTSYEQ